MHTSGFAQFFACVGSQSVPRFVVEPHTECGPELVVTLLHTLNWSALLHESGTAVSHEM